MVAKRLPATCPSCDSVLRVARMHCRTCGSSVEGDFALGVLVRLDADDQELVLSLVKASGSLKDLASEYGVSYPTIRNRVDALIERVKTLENDVVRDSLARDKEKSRER